MTDYIPGLVPKKLSFTIDGESVSATVVRANIDVEDQDAKFVPLGSDSAHKFILKFEAAQDYFDVDSLASKAWDHEDDIVPYVLEGMDAGGNIVRATGNCTISMANGTAFGGEMDNDSTERLRFEAEWICTAKPTLTRVAATP